VSCSNFSSLLPLSFPGWFPDAPFTRRGLILPPSSEVWTKCPVSDPQIMEEMTETSETRSQRALWLWLSSVSDSLFEGALPSPVRTLKYHEDAHMEKNGGIQPAGTPLGSTTSTPAYR